MESNKIGTLITAAVLVVMLVVVCGCTETDTTTPQEQAEADRRAAYAEAEAERLAKIHSKSEAQKAADAEAARKRENPYTVASTTAFGDDVYVLYYTGDTPDKEKIMQCVRHQRNKYRHKMHFDDSNKYNEGVVSVHFYTARHPVIFDPPTTSAHDHYVALGGDVDTLPGLVAMCGATARQPYCNYYGELGDSN